MSRAKNRLFAGYDIETTKGSYKKNKKQFKTKNGLYIQENKYRIGSMGEKNEITNKGLEKIRGFRL